MFFNGDPNREHQKAIPTTFQHGEGMWDRELGRSYELDRELGRSYELDREFVYHVYDAMFWIK